MARAAQHNQFGRKNKTDKNEANKNIDFENNCLNKDNCRIENLLLLHKFKIA